MSGTDVTDEQLVVYRAELDVIDTEVIALLGRRIEIGRQVARHKAANGIPVMQHGRVKLVQDRAAEAGLAVDLAPDFVRSLYGLIIDEMCRVEDEIVDGH